MLIVANFGFAYYNRGIAHRALDDNPVPQITPSNTMATDVRAQTRLVGYAGSPTQLKLHIGLDDPGSYVFVKENGECETQYCPRFMISDVETADNVFLVDDNGHRVTLVRRSQAG